MFSTAIVTLRLDETSQAFFDAMRQRHFPPERNLIPAHLTLFHKLPEEERIVAALALVSTETPSFPILVTGLRSLGRGAAYRIDSPDLLRLHAALADVFKDDLTAQDSQRFVPHIVVQNKATPEIAKSLLHDLTQSFQPMRAGAIGLDLWRYLGGPWQHLRTFPFSSPPERITESLRFWG